MDRYFLLFIIFRLIINRNNTRIHISFSNLVSTFYYGMKCIVFVFVSISELNWWLPSLFENSMEIQVNSKSVVVFGHVEK